MRAIIENPADDAPRLVLADWLDEHGQPERAEFIRLQCELELIELGHPEAAERHSALSDRCRSLLTAHEKAWVAADVGTIHVSPHSRFLFRRGMINEAMCPVRYFVTHGDRLLDGTPIKVIAFRRITAAHVRDLADCPGSQRVRGVRIQFREDSGPAVRALLEAWPFPAARTLDLSSSYVERRPNLWRDRWADVAVAAAQCPAISRLRRLSFVACGIGDSGGEAIADSPHLGDLAVLDLKHNPMSPAVQERLRERFGRRVFLEYEDHVGFKVGDLMA